MALPAERTNSRAALNSIIGWFIGLAYFNWLSPDATHVSLVGHIGLVVVGMLAAGVVIGMGSELLLDLVAKRGGNRTESNSRGFAWAPFLGPVIAFLVAEPAIRLVAWLVPGWR